MSENIGDMEDMTKRNYDENVKAVTELTKGIRKLIKDIADQYRRFHVNGD